MQHLYNNIPALLKQHHNWVAWGIRDSPPKSPFNPVSLLLGRPAPAKAGIKETWGSYQSAALCVKRGLAQGVGYEFDGGNIYGVDLDHVIDKAGTIVPEAQEVVHSLNSYAEISPSGTGIHIFVFAPGAEITRHRKKDVFLEIYNTGRYFTVTGNVLSDAHAIEARTVELQSIHDKFLFADTQQDAAPFATNIPISSNEGTQFLNIGLTRDKVFSALWAGARRIGNESADDIALMNKLAYWCNADINAMIQAFLSSPYYMQKDEPHKKKCKRAGYLPNTAKKAGATVLSTAVFDSKRWHQQRQYER